MWCTHLTADEEIVKNLTQFTHWVDIYFWYSNGPHDKYNVSITTKHNFQQTQHLHFCLIH